MPLSLEPMSDSDSVFGYTVSELQTGLDVEGSMISGTLNYIDSGSLATTWGNGNFMALDLSGNDFGDLTSVKVGLSPSAGSGLVEILTDPDRNGVFKVTDKDNQKFVVVQSDGVSTLTTEYSLSGLVLADE